MKATLHSDASVNQVERVGGWAMWAACPQGRVTHSGVLPEVYSFDSNVAELAAIVAGAFIVKHVWPNLDDLMIRCDNLSVMDILEKKHKGRGAMAELHSILREVLGETRVDPYWVKGHQVAKSSRSAWVNNECDGSARARMREAVGAKRNGLLVDPLWLNENVLALAKVTEVAEELRDQYNTKWLRLAAKYLSTCPACGHRVALGSPIMWNRDYGAYHSRCWTATEWGRLPNGSDLGLTEDPAPNGIDLSL